MARNINARRNPFRTCRRRRLDPSNKDARPWEDIHQDILMEIIMKLSLFDYLAFSSVCKSWRSAALVNRSTFFERKEPLLTTLSNKVCTFTNIFDDGRKYNTDLGTSSRGGDIVGVSCGYLIIRRWTQAFSELYLVNPITRHELHFSPLPENTPYDCFRPILVSWLSKPLVIILCRGRHNRNHHVLFSRPGDSEWDFLPIPKRGWNIVDLSFFKGKIYALNSDGRIGEMKLTDGLSSMKLLDLKRMPFLDRELVSSGEGLYMVSHPSWRSIEQKIIKHEFDFEKMEWVAREDIVGESLFINDVKSSGIVKTNNWIGDGRTEYESTYILPHGRNPAWYFPHECYTIHKLTDL